MSDDIQFADFASFPAENGEVPSTFSTSFSVTYTEGTIPDIPPLPDNFKCGLMDDVRASTGTATSSRATAIFKASDDVVNSELNTAITTKKLEDNVAFEVLELRDTSADDGADLHQMDSQLEGWNVTSGPVISAPVVEDVCSNSTAPLFPLPNVSQMTPVTKVLPILPSQQSKECLGDMCLFPQDLTSVPDEFSEFLFEPPQFGPQDEFGAVSSADDEFGGFETSIAVFSTSFEQHHTTVGVKVEQDFGEFTSSSNQLVNVVNNKRDWVKNVNL